jgi:hypothetical protein
LTVAVASAFALLPMIVLLAVGASPILIAAVGVCGGAAQSIFWTFWQTSLHENVPPATLSRISSYDWLGAYAFEPVGYALAGPAAALIGVTATLVGGAAVVAVGTVATLAVPEVRQLTAVGDREQSRTASLAIDTSYEPPLSSGDLNDEPVRPSPATAGTANPSGTTAARYPARPRDGPDHP